MNANSRLPTVLGECWSVATRWTPISLSQCCRVTEFEDRQTGATTFDRLVHDTGIVQCLHSIDQVLVLLDAETRIVEACAVLVERVVVGATDLRPNSSTGNW